MNTPLSYDAIVSKRTRYHNIDELKRCLTTLVKPQPVSVEHATIIIDIIDKNMNLFDKKWICFIDAVVKKFESFMIDAPSDFNKYRDTLNRLRKLSIRLSKNLEEGKNFTICRKRKHGDE